MFKAHGARNLTSGGPDEKRAYNLSAVRVEFTSKGDCDELKKNEGEAPTVVMLDFQSLRSGNPCSTKGGVDLFDQFCSFAPIIVITDERVVLGYYHNIRFLVAQGFDMHSCAIVQATGVKQFPPIGTLFYVDIEVEESNHVRILESTIYTIVFRMAVPFAYALNALRTIQVLRQRARAHSPENKTINVILGANFLQSLVLCVMNAIGCMHWMSTVCTNVVHLVLFNNLLGCSLGTTYLFCGELVKVLAVLQKKKKPKMIRFRIAFVVFSSIDVLCAAFFLTDTTSFSVRTFIFLVAPSLSILGLFFVTGLLYAMSRRILLIVVKGSRDTIAKCKTASDSIIWLTAQKFVKRGRMVLMSATITAISMLFVATSNHKRETSIFVLHVSMYDIAKVLWLWSLTSSFEPIDLKSSSKVLNSRPSGDLSGGTTAVELTSSRTSNST